MFRTVAWPEIACPVVQVVFGLEIFISNNYVALCSPVSNRVDWCGLVEWSVLRVGSNPDNYRPHCSWVWIGSL